jgi:hypothetical protein
VQDAHEHPDHCLIADDGQDLFTDTSMVFANDRHVRVVVGEREQVKVNKYGEKCRRVGTNFQPLVLEARSGGMSKTKASTTKKHAMLAGHRIGSDPMFLHRRWLQKLSVKVLVLHANLVAMCMPYGDADHTRSPTLFWLAVLYIVVQLTLADSKAVLLAYYASLKLFSCSYFTYILRSAVAQPNLLARRSRPLMSGLPRRRRGRG